METRIILLIWSLFCILYSSSLSCLAAGTISQGQAIRDGEFVVSQDGTFALGFFSPRNSSSRYVGIWYYNVPLQSVVWIANRNSPISDNSGVLTVADDGNLVVLDGNGRLIWSTNVTDPQRNSTAILSDSGELVLRRETNHVLWRSFEHPTDTFLPNMRVYIDDKERRVFSSWRNDRDPAPGRYSLGLDPRGSLQIVIWEGEYRRWRSGHFNGVIFTGVPSMSANSYLFGFDLQRERDGRLYLAYIMSNSSDLINFRISWNGMEEQRRWNNDTEEWNVIQEQPLNECELYNRCGNFGKCDITGSSSICSCLDGFVPGDFDQWNAQNFTGGCVRRAELQCERDSRGEGGNRDGFAMVEDVKLPDFADLDRSGDIRECERKCRENCSCTAYAFGTGINCLIWRGELTDIQHFAGGGNTMFIRLAHSELGGSNKRNGLVIAASTIAGTICVAVFVWLLWRYGARQHEKKKKSNIPIKVDPGRSQEFSTECSGGQCNLRIEGQQETSSELLLFSFDTVAEATNNFSDQNKLGQGGFGTVHKGKLPGGEIAVKRLSRKSGQGLEEFKNEIRLIARLQHRNLVRLLGCTVQGEEKMIIYEYMPNKSLDSFIFDPAKQAELDWGKRFAIIEGIARGLLYLHRDSRLRIIHRDLKAGNILLDEELNPKISDFGMARIFGGNQNEENTNRVVGTYGYMAPEYAMEGLFSVKSDVYSFGILLLEIISGRKNTSFRSTEYSHIIRYAWELWDKDTAMELIDPSIVNSCSYSEFLRCIHIGLLCVQDSAIYRPNMSAVVLMLESEGASLPMPSQPTFTSMRRSQDDDIWIEKQDTGCSNNITLSIITGR